MLYIFNFFFFNDTATTEIYTLSLHDALPIWVMDELPELRMVGRYGVGYDIVDVEAARERGVWVANVPDYGTQEVAVHALSLALSLLRHLPLYDRDVRAGRWHSTSTGPLHRLRNSTLGVVGLGRIGGTFARRASPWFGRTLGCDPYLEDDAWPEEVEPATLEEVFSESLVVSLHPPLTDETNNFIDRGLLERMPEGSYLVNTARGGHPYLVVAAWPEEVDPATQEVFFSEGLLLSPPPPLTDETNNFIDRGLLERMPEGSYLVNTARGGLVVIDDLLWALEDGPLAGAALDVLPQEPPPRSEEHTSELQSRQYLVCRLLLEKKNIHG